MLEHGGRLSRAAAKYGRPVQAWLDLSTGINPLGLPVGAIPAECWQRLPEGEDGLLDAAQAYYGNPSLLLMSGSQAAIQALPQLRPPGRVAVLHPSYAEHGYQWRCHGHEVESFEPGAMSEAINTVDVAVIVNPNNPSGHLISPETLLEWHQRLSARGGWLVVDEAFMDTTPESSLLPFAPLSGLIVLRSLGKFFGLAGLRVGAVCAERVLLERLDEMQGPWPLTTASRWVARQALLDIGWQQAAQVQLQAAAQRLRGMLVEAGFEHVYGTALFQWVPTANAARLYELFAQKGILLRQFEAPVSLRFGLPGDEGQWQRLAEALNDVDVRRELGNLS